jgi:hypothetical protein
MSRITMIQVSIRFLLLTDLSYKLIIQAMLPSHIHRLGNFALRHLGETIICKRWENLALEFIDSHTTAQFAVLRPFWLTSASRRTPIKPASTSCPCQNIRIRAKPGSSVKWQFVIEAIAGGLRGVQNTSGSSTIILPTQNAQSVCHNFFRPGSCEHENPSRNPACMMPQ